MSASAALKKQHLIDPEICIRCYTCESMCQPGAITHDDLNVVVDFTKCNYCMDCIAPCPTGSIDVWRIVETPYTLEAQLGWSELPAQEDFGEAASAITEALDADVGAMLEKAHAGTGGKPVAPASASKPSVNLYARSKPAVATVQGNFRITAASAESDIRHIVLSFGDTVFPVLEGQSIGIVPPGTRADGSPHDIRLYSIASARDGEKRNANNVSLTIKRTQGGIGSNYMCDLKVGDKVHVTGPFGAHLPDAQRCRSQRHHDLHRHRLRTVPRLHRTPPPRHAKRPRQTDDVLRRPRPRRNCPTSAHCRKCREKLLQKYLVYSRIPGQPKEYVQDRMRKEAAAVAPLLKSASTHIFICGLKGMEAGVDEALADICRANGLDWTKLKPEMRQSGRYHVETY